MRFTRDQFMEALIGWTFVFSLATFIGVCAIGLYLALSHK